MPIPFTPAVTPRNPQENYPYIPSTPRQTFTPVLSRNPLDCNPYIPSAPGSPWEGRPRFHELIYALADEFNALHDKIDQMPLGNLEMQMKGFSTTTPRTPYSLRRDSDDRVSFLANTSEEMITSTSMPSPTQLGCRKESLVQHKRGGTDSVTVSVRSVTSDRRTLRISDKDFNGTPTPVSNDRPSAIIAKCKYVSGGSRTLRAKKTEEIKSTTMHLLETGPVLVILANAITIGMSADIAPESSVWDVLEATWVSFYTLEFVAKNTIFGCRDYFLGSNRYWNWFDVLCLQLSFTDLVITHVIKTLDLGNDNILGLIKILRLARLARIIRALHFPMFNELKQMVLGVVHGVRVLVWAIILFMVVIFFMGVMMNTLMGEEIAELETVPNAMFSVFRCYTDGCVDYQGRPLAERLLENYGALFFFGYILSFMFVTVGIFNLIMAIFIENVVGQGLKRKLEELGASTEPTEALVKETLAKLIRMSFPEEFGSTPVPAQDFSAAGQPALDYEADFDKMVKDGVSISKDVFNDWLNRIEMNDMLEQASVEVAEKEGLFDVLDVDSGGELGLDELIDGIMTLRGPITKSDIVAVRLKVRYVTSMIEEMWCNICG